MSGDATQREDERQMLRESIAAFCRDRLDIRRLRSLQQAGSDFDRTVWQKMAEMGWVGLWIPEEHGGLGLGRRRRCGLAGAALTRRGGCAGASGRLASAGQRDQSGHTS